MSAKHTPGPWAVELPNDRTPNIWLVAKGNAGICKIEPCDYDDGQGHRITEEDRANAHLIALAPEMAEALRAIELAVDGLNTKGYPQQKNTQLALDRIKGHCRALLAKLDKGEA